MFSGALMLLALYIAVTSFKYLRGLDTYSMLILLLTFSTAVGVHGVSHVGLEQAYGYPSLSALR
jgi:hypothetical protein